MMCGFLFWWFDYRFWGAYPSQVIQFDSAAIKKLYSILKPSTSNFALVVHFVDDSCPCEAYRKAHVMNIDAILSNVDNILVTQNEAKQLGFAVPASPSVAVWDQQGELAYFGPYSSGMTCGQGFDFVTMTFEKLQMGNNPKWVNTQGFGCFCPW